MTRIGHQNLTANNRTGTISYDRTLEFLVIYNNNPVPLYIRLGSPEIPNELNYDISVPANYIMAISVNSNQFGFRLGNSNVVITQISGVSVIEATIDEAPPSLGGVPINNASLSTSDFLNGFQTYVGPTTYGPFNLTQWGGMIVNVMPATGVGQAVIQIDVSSNGVVWLPYQTWAIWPNIPATILVQRVSQFVRVTINSTAIVGEPGIVGNLTIRGSLAEISASSYTPQDVSITKTYALAASGSQQYQFVTPGIPAVSIAAIATAGTGASAAITLLVEASSDLVNWRQVTFRTQRMTTGITLYRALGNLDLFMRVTVFEVGGISAANGTVYLSIPKNPDLGAILNTIQQSLGDTNAPSNTNQDIYHELDNVRTGINSTNTNLGTTITNQGTIISTLNTSNANLSAISNNTVTVANAQTRGTTPQTFQWACGAVAGTQYPSPAFLAPGFYAVSLFGTCKTVAGGAPGIIELQIATGTNAIPLQTIHREYIVLSGVAGNYQSRIGPISYGSIRSPGFVVPAGHTTLWAATDVALGGTPLQLDIIIPLAA